MMNEDRTRRKSHREVVLVHHMYCIASKDLGKEGIAFRLENLPSSVWFYCRDEDAEYNCRTTIRLTSYIAGLLCDAPISPCSHLHYAICISRPALHAESRTSL